MEIFAAVALTGRMSRGRSRWEAALDWAHKQEQPPSFPWLLTCSRREVGTRHVKIRERFDNVGRKLIVFLKG